MTEKQAMGYYLKTMGIAMKEWNENRIRLQMSKEAADAVWEKTMTPAAQKYYERIGD